MKSATGNSNTTAGEAAGWTCAMKPDCYFPECKCPLKVTDDEVVSSIVNHLYRYFGIDPKDVRRW